MSQQNHQNHARYYVLHHFIFYPVVIAGLIYSLTCVTKYPDHSREWMAISVLFLLAGWLSFMLRQHYSLGNQDRIIRAEMRLRYYILTQKNFQPFEKQLSFRQLAALRFASDEELPELLQKAVSGNLTSHTIKKMIKNWEPDYMRV